MTISSAPPKSNLDTALANLKTTQTNFVQQIQIKILFLIRVSPWISLKLIRININSSMVAALEVVVVAMVTVVVRVLFNCSICYRFGYDVGNCWHRHSSSFYVVAYPKFTPMTQPGILCKLWPNLCKFPLSHNNPMYLLLCSMLFLPCSILLCNIMLLNSSNNNQLCNFLLINSYNNNLISSIPLKFPRLQIIKCHSHNQLLHHPLFPNILKLCVLVPLLVLLAVGF